jgi:hypothetical protein
MENLENIHWIISAMMNLEANMNITFAIADFSDISNIDALTVPSMVV